jgi:hypothetical protein
MLIDAGHRPNPDALLRQVEAEETTRYQGRLMIFLGYASGKRGRMPLADRKYAAARVYTCAFSVFLQGVSGRGRLLPPLLRPTAALGSTSRESY